MTVASALFFHAAQRRRKEPGLDEGLNYQAMSLVPEDALALTERRTFDPFLIARPFEEARRNGFVGVPLLSENEVAAMLDDSSQGDEVPHGRWWEFWKTETSDFALLPGDDTVDAAIVVPAIVRTGSTVQLRRFATGFVLRNGLARRLSPPAIQVEACTIEDTDVPGAPYRGRCQNHGCEPDCSPKVVYYADTNLYRLQGCSCSQ